MDKRLDYVYTMKGLDRGLWNLAKSKAALTGESLKSVIERLLTEWVYASK